MLNKLSYKKLIDYLRETKDTQIQEKLDEEKYLKFLNRLEESDLYLIDDKALIFKYEKDLSSEFLFSFIKKYDLNLCEEQLFPFLLKIKKDNPKALSQYMLDQNEAPFYLCDEDYPLYKEILIKKNMLERYLKYNRTMKKEYVLDILNTLKFKFKYDEVLIEREDCFKEILDYIIKHPKSEFFHDEDLMIALAESGLEKEEFLSFLRARPKEYLVSRYIDDFAPVDAMEIILEFELNCDDYFTTLKDIELNPFNLELWFLHSNHKEEILSDYRDNIPLEVILSKVEEVKDHHLIYFYHQNQLTINDLKKFNRTELNYFLLDKIAYKEFFKTQKLDYPGYYAFLNLLEDQKLLVFHFDDLLEAFPKPDWQKVLIGRLDEDDLKAIIPPNSYIYRLILERFPNYKSYVDLEKEDLFKLIDRYKISPHILSSRVKECLDRLIIRDNSKEYDIYSANEDYLFSYNKESETFDCEYLTEQDKDVLLDFFNTVDKRPDQMKVIIYKDLSIDCDFKMNISRIEDLSPYFDFYGVEQMEVLVKKQGSSYIVVNELKHDTRQKAEELINSLEKQKLSSMDNLFFQQAQLNNERAFGIECEFSLEPEFKVADFDIWKDMEPKQLKAFVDENYPEALEHIDVNNIKESFYDYLDSNFEGDLKKEEAFEDYVNQLQNAVSKFDSEKSIKSSLEAYDSEGDTWDLKTDESIDSEFILGMELASPKLYGKAGVETFKNILNSLNLDSLNLENAGIHVHHDISDIIEANLSSSEILEKFAPLQDFLFQLVDEGRSSLEACKKYGLKEIYDNDRGSIDVSGRDTLEFRMKEGSIDADDIANWVILTHEIVEQMAQNILQKSKLEISFFDKMINYAKNSFKRRVINTNQIHKLLELHAIAQKYTLNA